MIINLAKLYWRELSIVGLSGLLAFQFMNRKPLQTVTVTETKEIVKKVVEEKIVEVQKIEYRDKTRAVNRVTEKLNPQNGVVVERIVETEREDEHGGSTSVSKEATKTVQDESTRTRVDSKTSTYRPSTLLGLGYGIGVNTIIPSVAYRLLPSLPGYLSIGVPIKITEPIKLPGLQVGLIIEL
jgi:hypothetical protein